MVKRKRRYSTNKRSFKRNRVSNLSRRIRKLECKTRDARYATGPITSIPNSSQGITTSGWTVDLLANLVQGDDYFNEFEGSEIYLKYVRCNLTLEYGDPTYNNVRIMVWQFKEIDNPAVPAITNILEPPSDPTGWPLTSYRKSQSGRYRILYDRFVTLQGTVPNSANYKSVRVSVKIPKVGSCSRYDRANSRFHTNTIYISFISDSGVVPTPQLKPTDWLLRYDA